jgi:hypothetical protein
MKAFTDKLPPGHVVAILRHPNNPATPQPVVVNKSTPLPPLYGNTMYPFAVKTTANPPLWYPLNERVHYVMPSAPGGGMLVPYQVPHWAMFI